MSPTPAQPQWELEGPYGLERWFGKPGHFDRVLLGTRPVSLDPSDGELGLLRPRQSTCAHPGPWPFGFAFCPECGARLQSPPPAEDAGQTWSSPGNGASGQVPPQSRGRPDPAGRAELPMPGPSDLDFFVAGTPSCLLAFDRTTGRVHRWVDGPDDAFAGGRWRELQQLRTPVSLPRWSWSVAAFAGSVVIPGDTGPLRVTLLPTSPTTVEAGPGMQRCLGGAAALGDVALVPVLAGDGLALAVWQSAEQGWQRIPVANATPQAARQIFAAPSTSTTEAFWSGEHGQLFARVAGDAVTCEYRPWQDGFQPMQGVRPVLSPNGVFHQLGRLDGRQAFEALIPPGATPQLRPFDRYVTSCGSATFGGTTRFREPWEPKRMEYRGEANAFLLPLLAFDDDRFVIAACSPRVSLRSFIETTGPSDAVVECRIMFAGASVALTDLRVTIRARSAWEIVPFIYRRNLLVYDQPANRCARWPLNAA